MSTNCNLYSHNLQLIILLVFVHLLLSEGYYGLCQIHNYNSIYKRKYPNTSLAPSHLCSFLKPVAEFPKLYAVSFLSLVRFVGIGGIVDHHYLSFLLIICTFYQWIFWFSDCYKPRDKERMRKGARSVYDKWNISVVICDTYILYA